MTTIAITPDCIFTDSMCSDGDAAWSVVKAERIGDSILATAGLSGDGELFYAWVKRGRRGKRPVVDSSFYAVELSAKGMFLYDATLVPQRLINNHAIGSGGKPAMAAMLAGADPRRAVEIACVVDASSRLPIQEYRLDERAQ